jgi:hypothetical protein
LTTLTADIGTCCPGGPETACAQALEPAKRHIAQELTPHFHHCKRCHTHERTLDKLVFFNKTRGQEESRQRWTRPGCNVGGTDPCANTEADALVLVDGLLTAARYQSLCYTTTEPNCRTAAPYSILSRAALRVPPPSL